MDYTVRKSQRARHVWLRFDASGSLVVVVPRKFDERKVPGIVEANREWIRRTAARVESRQQSRARPSVATLPDRISLPGIGEEYSVDYRATASHVVTGIRRFDGSVILSGAIHDADACRRALLRWLHRAAHRTLTPTLFRLAAESGFSVRRVSIRLQRTRWGSCSRGGAISLSVRLLFVAPALVRHVMLHELCHTSRMDHSDQFWSMLERHDPDWRQHRRQLRAAWHDVPLWLTSDVVGSSELTSVKNMP